MRVSRLPSIILAFSVLLPPSLVLGSMAQGVGDAEEAADQAQQRAEVAEGLVDQAVANREALELELAHVIARSNELSNQLSTVGAALDLTASQLGFADLELARIQTELEDQAVDAYMMVLASPSVSLVGTSVERAMVAGAVVGDVVAAGRASVDELVIKRRSLEQLQETYLRQEEEYRVIKQQLDDEIEKLASLYEQADADVAAAVRRAQIADAEYRAALGAVDQARIREEERRRQEARATDSTTTTTSSTSTSATPPQTTSTTAPSGGGGGGGNWNHPPQVERWRSLVSQFFPSARVDEALAIINCESNGDPDAYNPYSGAAGLFQFIPSTWASTAPKAGYPDSSPFEPEANVASAAWLANRYQELGLDYWEPWSCRRVLG